MILMNKYKWLIVNLPINLVELSELLSSHKFKNDSQQGFIISKASKSELSGKFLEKRVLIKEVFNPFGLPNEVSTVDYIITEFSIYLVSSKKFYLLELKNPPRTVKPFINFLNKTMGFGFTLKEFKFDPIQFSSKIESVFGKIIINKVSVSELNLNNKATANIQISSETDIREILTSKIFVNKKFKIKSIQGSFIASEYSGGKLQLFSNSTVVLSHLPERFFLKEFIHILLEKDYLN